MVCGKYFTIIIYYYPILSKSRDIKMGEGNISSKTTNKTKKTKNNNNNTNKNKQKTKTKQKQHKKRKKLKLKQTNKQAK